MIGLMHPVIAKAKVVSWDVLSQYEDPKQDIPLSIKNLQKHKITLIGFIVPIIVDESYENVDEFILVPDPLSCMHVPPPSENQMVYVRMKKPVPIDIDFLGVEVTGTLSFPKTDTDFGELFYFLNGDNAIESDLEVDDYYDELDFDYD